MEKVQMAPDSNAVPFSDEDGNAFIVSTIPNYI